MVSSYFGHLFTIHPLRLTGAKTRYNLRVVETLTAARIFARRLGLSVPDTWRPTLREVLSLYIAQGEPSLQAEVKGQNDTAQPSEVLEKELQRILEELESHKDELGGEEGLPVEEMIELSGLGEKEFRAMYLDWVDGEPFLDHFGCDLKLKKIPTRCS